MLLTPILFTVVKNTKMKKEIIYLGLPYSFDPELSHAIASEITAELISSGKIVISVVNMYHNVANYLPLEQRHSNSFWMDIDLPILRVCDKLLVVLIGSKGHQLVAESEGCQGEINEAIKRNIPISYINYDYERN